MRTFIKGIHTISDHIASLKVMQMLPDDSLVFVTKSESGNIRLDWERVNVPKELKN